MKQNSKKILENIYHKGQKNIWDGKAVLENLLEKHNGIKKIDNRKARALQSIFSVILEGENAAWKISLQLADRIENIEARMAATSQAHDEARHFYVMRDYLKLIECDLKPVPAPVKDALSMIMSTKSLPKKLLGMQLMVEPVALTIFQEVRRISPEPVLADLLEYFERDEARHVALGVHHLPIVVKDIGKIELISLITWQLKIFMLELKGLKELQEDFEILGLDIEEVFALAEKKQLEALKDFVEVLGLRRSIWEPVRYFIRYQKSRILK